MKPQLQRPPRPLDTYELVLAGGWAPPTPSEWASAQRVDAVDAADAAQVLATRLSWVPVQVWVRGPGEPGALFTVEKPTGVRP
jgi:hypothetical protein